MRLDDYTPAYAHKMDDFHGALEVFETTASQLGLHISWQKTKIQNLGAGDSTPCPPVCDHSLEEVTEFTYLGSVQSTSGRCQPDIIRRIGIAFTAMHSMNKVWRQTRLQLQTELRLYQTCILSILLCGSETWTLLQEDLRKLEAFHMRCQRMILGIGAYAGMTLSETQKLSTGPTFPLFGMSSPRDETDCSAM